MRGWWRRWLSRAEAVVRKETLDGEFDRELAAHIQLASDENVAHGMTIEQARQAALIRLGGAESTREIHRKTRGIPVIESLLPDIRFGPRVGD